MVRKGSYSSSSRSLSYDTLLEPARGSAWNNRHRVGADLILKRRRQGQPAEVIAIALKAQHRLYRKFWRLDQRKHRHVAITAVARELCDFAWAILEAVAWRAALRTKRREQCSDRRILVSSMRYGQCPNARS